MHSADANREAPMLKMLFEMDALTVCYGLNLAKHFQARKEG